MQIETEGLRLVRLINGLEPVTRRCLDEELSAGLRLPMWTSYHYFWLAVLQSFGSAALLLTMGWKPEPWTSPVFWAGVAMGLAGVLQLTGRGMLNSVYLQNEFRAALTRAGICAGCGYAYREVKDSKFERCPECGISLDVIGN